MSESNGLEFIDVDLTGVEPHDGSGFERVEDGDYEFEITAAPIKSASTGSGSQHEVTFTVVCNADGSETSMAGRTCRGWYGIETDFGRRRLSNLLSATGVYFDSKGYKASELVGKHLLATVTTKTYVKLDPATGQEREVMGSNVSRERAVPSAVVAKGNKQGRPAARPQVQR